MNVPNGYRLLADDEIVIEGDRCFGSSTRMRRSEIMNWVLCSSSVGMTVTDAISAHGCITAYCRPIEVEFATWTGEWEDAEC